MGITTIILSKDRPAQLDLLLRSIEKNGGGQFDSTVIYSPSAGYEKVAAERGHFVPEFPGSDERGFESVVRGQLEGAGEFVCFMCDDGILYRPLPTHRPESLLLSNQQMLCFSLRLGENTTTCYPTDIKAPFDHGYWEPNSDGQGLCAWPWGNREPDWGYPGSIDGHIFRTDDMRRILAGRKFTNPTALECALVEGCNELAEERPLMACYPHSVYVGNPINRVSEQSNVRYGATYPVTAEECNRRFLTGERIDLERMDFSHVNGAHTEIELQWQ